MSPTIRLVRGGGSDRTECPEAARRARRCQGRRSVPTPGHRSVPCPGGVLSSLALARAEAAIRPASFVCGNLRPGGGHRSSCGPWRCAGSTLRSRCSLENSQCRKQSVVYTVLAPAWLLPKPHLQIAPAEKNLVVHMQRGFAIPKQVTPTRPTVLERPTINLCGRLFPPENGGKQE